MSLLALTRHSRKPVVGLQVYFGFRSALEDTRTATAENLYILASAHQAIRRSAIRLKDLGKFLRAPAARTSIVTQGLLHCGWPQSPLSIRRTPDAFQPAVAFIPGAQCNGAAAAITSVHQRGRSSNHHLANDHPQDIAATTGETTTSPARESGCRGSPSPEPSCV